MNKTVLITGCSSGIGREFVREFLRRGFRVVATARRPESLSEFEDNENVIVKKLDVTNEDDIRSLVEFFKSEKSSPDILVNNAGYGLMSPTLELPIEEVKKQFDTNVFGALRLVSALVPLMIEKGKGLVVNISSISGILTTPFAGAYCASKAALTSFSDALRLELAPFGINVVTVEPGAIESDFGKNASKTTANILQYFKIYAKYKDAVMERAEASQKNATPTGKFVKKVVRKILSPNPPAYVRGGKLSLLVPFLKKCFPWKLRDKILRKMFGLNE